MQESHQRQVEATFQSEVNAMLNEQGAGMHNAKHIDGNAHLSTPKGVYATGSHASGRPPQGFGESGSWTVPLNGDVSQAKSGGW